LAERRWRERPRRECERKLFDLIGDEGVAAAWRTIQVSCGKDEAVFRSVAAHRASEDPHRLGAIVPHRMADVDLAQPEFRTDCLPKHLQACHQ
jgi:hypothetical protein